MAYCILSPRITEALEEYRAKFGRDFPVEVLPQEDEELIINEIRACIEAGKPTRKRRKKGAVY